MRLLLFSDLHLDAPGADTSPGDVRAAFQRICELAASLGVDAVCGAGNLYDQSSKAPDTAEVLRSGFDAISPIPVFLAPGSSDCLSPGSLYRETAWSTNVHVFREPHLTPLTIANGVTLWGAAHVQPVHPVGFLSTGDLRNAGVNIALFHGCERTEFAEVDGPITAPFHAHQIRESGLDHALLGHLPVPSAAADYTYPGRPAPRHPGGPAAGGAVLVTVHSEGSVQREWYDLFDAESVWDKTPDEPDDGPAGIEDVFEKPAAVWVAAADEDDPGDPIPSIPVYPESTVRGQFVRSVRHSELSPADRRRVLSIGLAALDGHTEFGEL